MKRRILILAFAMFSITAMAQVAINTDSSLPDNSAMLDVKSITKGLLMPRMTQAQRNAIVTPAAGLTIFQTDNTPGIYFNSGTSAAPVWVMAGSGSGGTGTGWSTTGNGATNPAINFIGTTDNKDLIFKRSSVWAGVIGVSNTSFGLSAFNSSSTGGYNSAFGDYALAYNTAGNNNTASGFNALYFNTTGGYNTASGNSSLYANTTGGFNTASGSDALYANTIGSSNTASGFNALYFNTTGGSNTASGSSSLYANTTGGSNTASGSSSLYANTTGNFNVAIGNSALSSVTTGSNNIGIGNNAQVPTATASNQVCIGNALITYAGIQVAWTITSDRRLKTDIKKSELGLGFIKKLNPVSYTRMNDSAKKTEYGFIAQEVEETLKNLGLSNTGMVSKDDKGMYSVRYNDLFAPMVKALQEQQGIIEADKAKIKTLEEENRRQKEDVKQQKEVNKLQLEINNQLESRLKAIEAKLK